MNRRQPMRYDIMEEPEGTWTVYDIFTGVAYAGDKLVATGIGREFAGRFSNVLNKAYRRHLNQHVSQDPELPV